MPLRGQRQIISQLRTTVAMSKSLSKIKRIKGKVEDWQGSRGVIVADPDAVGGPFGDSWFHVRKYNLEPDADDIPVEIGEEVAFLWGHENDKMIAFDVLRLQWLTPRVFLAHSSSDKSFVRDLARRLRQADVRVWLDEWEICVGDSIVEKIEQGLRESDYLAVVLSAASVDSAWVKRELNSAIMRQMTDQSITVLPVLREHCDIPAVIADIYYADCSRNIDKGVTDLVNAIRSQRYDL